MQQYKTIVKYVARGPDKVHHKHAGGPTPISIIFFNVSLVIVEIYWIFLFLFGRFKSVKITLVIVFFGIS